MTEETPDTFSSCKFSDRAQDTGLCAHLSVVQRYYTPRYKIDLGDAKDEHHCVLTHSNKVCIITLAKSHPIMRDGKTVTEVNYQMNESSNSLTNKVEGKSKKGAKEVQPQTAICRVSCSDGSQYKVYACVKGNVVEANARLTSEPQLLTQKPQTEGYIAILLCKLRDYPHEVAKLLTDEQYQRAFSSHQQMIMETVT